MKERKKWWHESPPDKTFTEQLEERFGSGTVYTLLSCAVWALIFALMTLLVIFICNL